MKTIFAGKQAVKISDQDFDLVSMYKWRSNGRYAIASVWLKDKRKYKTVLMHRLIMDTPKGMLTDHRDGDTFNNQRENLRICTHAENSRNARIKITNNTGYRGVRFMKKCPNRPWVATIKAGVKQYHLGSFSTPEEAARVYNSAALTYHGEFAKLNTVKEF